jgi:uncharacterized membrane protein YdbT with pleckstrin-like domain
MSRLLAMAFPQRLLGQGEEVVLHMRTHAKALLIPVLVLLVAAAAVGFGMGVLPESGSGAAGRWVLLAIALGVIARWSVWPFLVWLSTTYTVTTERLVTRQGVVSRYGRDIPLGRINDVAYNQDLVDRMLRCGSLNVSAASEHGTIVLRDVPRVHEVQLEMSELVREAHGWSSPQRRTESKPESGTDEAERRTRPLPRDQPYDWSLGEPGQRDRR